jgi:hypothetical protein
MSVVANEPLERQEELYQQERILQKKNISAEIFSDKFQIFSDKFFNFTLKFRKNYPQISEKNTLKFRKKITLKFRINFTLIFYPIILDKFPPKDNKYLSSIEVNY